MSRASILFVLALAATAAADSGPQGDLAKQHFDDGKRAYDAGDFTGASAAFEAGYAIEPWNGFLYMWAQAVRRSGDCSKAVVLYQRFLATDPPEPARTPAAKNVIACGGTVEPAKLPPPPEQPEKAIDKPVSPPIPPKPAIVHDDPRDIARPIGIATIGLGLASEAIAVRYYLLERDDAKQATTAGIYRDVQALSAFAAHDLTVARITAGVGIGLVAAGVVIVLRARPTPARVDVAVVHGGGALTIGGRF